jgi:hypothetical protein
LIDILQIQCADNVKSWALRPDGKYERVSAKAGSAIVRSQARFIEMTRDRLKAADGVATSRRVHLHSLPNGRGNLDSKASEARRVRREARQMKKV